MKTAVAITLIISGVALVAMPPLSDAWQTLLVARLLEHGMNNVNLNGGRMEEPYRLGCWLAGIAMIIAGALPSVRGSSAPAVRPMPVAQAV